MNTENNKLIAEFMGAYVGNPVDGKEVMCGVPAYYSKKGYTNTHLTNDLKYHTSWDWLMSVVEKIEQLYDADTIILIQEDTCHFYGGKFELFVDEYNKFDSVYKGCLEFIKWYNQQKH